MKKFEQKNKEVEFEEKVGRRKGLWRKKGVMEKIDYFPAANSGDFRYK